jgi:hypothetical protein
VLLRCCCVAAVALGKFNEGVVSYDEEGEVELDLEKVDFASLMEVSAAGTLVIVSRDSNMCLKTLLVVHHDTREKGNGHNIEYVCG